MLVFDDDSLAFSVAETVANNYMVDYMKEDFELVCKFMHIILLIVKAADPELFQHFQSAKLEPFFATSWLLTWFAHDIKNLDDSARVFDVLLASPPMFSFYLTAAVIIISLFSIILSMYSLSFFTVSDTYSRLFIGNRT